MANSSPFDALPARVNGWQIRATEGPSGAFHHHSLDELADASCRFAPTIWIHRPSVPALVLGSAQPFDAIDEPMAVSAGWEVAKRRSGGGLVVLHPGAGLWVDVFIPPTHPEWVDDVGLTFDFVGRWWQRTLAAVLGPTRPTVEVHRGPLLRADLGRHLCFAGLGPGEVTVGNQKVVGLSQRRSRAGARFQCLAQLEADDAIVAEFAAEELRRALAEAPPYGWPPALPRPSPAELARAFVDAAPTPG